MYDISCVLDFYVCDHRSMFVFTWWSSLGKPSLESLVDDEIEQMPHGENEHLKIPPHHYEGHVRHSQISDSEKPTEMRAGERCLLFGFCGRVLNWLLVKASL